MACSIANQTSQWDMVEKSAWNVTLMMMRINYCPKYCHVNQYGKADKIDFEKVHSDELTEAMTVINAILNVWNLEHGKNTVKRGAN